MPHSEHPSDIFKWLLFSKRSTSHTNNQIHTVCNNNSNNIAMGSNTTSLTSVLLHRPWPAILSNKKAGHWRMVNLAPLFQVGLSGNRVPPKLQCCFLSSSSLTSVAQRDKQSSGTKNPSSSTTQNPTGSTTLNHLNRCTVAPSPSHLKPWCDHSLARWASSEAARRCRSLPSRAPAEGWPTSRRSSPRRFLGQKAEECGYCYLNSHSLSIC